MRTRGRLTGIFTRVFESTDKTCDPCLPRASLLNPWTAVAHSRATPRPEHSPARSDHITGTSKRDKEGPGGHKPLISKKQHFRIKLLFSKKQKNKRIYLVSLCGLSLVSLRGASLVSSMLFHHPRAPCAPASDTPICQ